MHSDLCSCHPCITAMLIFSVSSLHNCIWDLHMLGSGVTEMSQLSTKVEHGLSFHRLMTVHCANYQANQHPLPGQAINRKLKPANRKLKPVNRKLKPLNREPKPRNQKPQLNRKLKQVNRKLKQVNRKLKPENRKLSPSNGVDCKGYSLFRSDNG